MVWLLLYTRNRLIGLRSPSNRKYVIDKNLYMLLHSLYCIYKIFLVECEYILNKNLVVYYTKILQFIEITVYTILDFDWLMEKRLLQLQILSKKKKMLTYFHVWWFTIWANSWNYSNKFEIGLVVIYQLPTIYYIHSSLIISARKQIKGHVSKEEEILYVFIT